MDKTLASLIKISEADILEKFKDWLIIEKTDKKTVEEMDFECIAFARFIKLIHPLMVKLLQDIGQLM